MKRARPAVKVLVAAGLAALIVAQARAVVFLHAQLDAPSPRDGNPWYEHLEALMALQQGRFHLFGTLLTAALASAVAGGAGGLLAPLESKARTLFIPLSLSILTWLLWAVGGFRKHNLASGLVGTVGFASGIVIPLVALISFAIRLYRSPAERPAAGLGMIFAASILVWTLAFVAFQLSIALAM